MLKKAGTQLWLPAWVLAMACGATILSGQGQSGNQSRPETLAGKQKGATSPKQEEPTVDPSQYVGAETCKTCHEEVAASYDKGPHWKTTLAKHQGPEYQGCEACHGPGRLMPSRVTQTKLFASKDCRVWNRRSDA